MAAIRRPIALASAAATAVALGATVLAAAPATAADTPLKDYRLTWGVKESYRTYVTGMAAGRITPAGGAEQAKDNGPLTFVDGTGSYDTDKHTVSLAFKGSVNFTSKLHGFDVKLSDVRFDSAKARITADVSKDGGAAQDDVPLADVTVTRSMTDMKTKLTKEADEALGGGGRYTGAAGDPLTVAQKSPEPTPTPTPTKTPTQPPTGTASPTTRPTGTSAPTETTHPGPTSSTPSTPSTAKPSSSQGRPEGTVFDGSLAWGVKESFRRYIESGGTAALSGGAQKNDNGYDFPYAKADLDSDAKKLTASFGGAVRFQYKAHGIDMKFSDIKVAADGAKGTLTVDVTTPKGTDDDVKFATLDLSKVSYEPKDDVVVLDKVPAAFTAAGARQFASDQAPSQYKEGDPIDPVTLALTLTADGKLPSGGTAGTGGTGGSAGSGDSGNSGNSGNSGSTGGGSVSLGDGADTVGGGSGSLASTGAGVPSGALLGAAGAVVAVGAGAMYAARRRQRTDASMRG
ncbi:HtaA domain-containing protein [Streptomyces sp. NPDC059009]|uniref:HtaA domain-containing protein n=1 Tax=Streptomyces sp. NPDC059009 TaxID=3346694 RepID=UPI0036A22143